MDTPEAQRERQVTNWLGKLEREIACLEETKNRFTGFMSPIMPETIPLPTSDTSKVEQTLVPLASQLRNYTNQISRIVEQFEELLNLNEL